MPANPTPAQLEQANPEGIAAMIPVANITLEDALLDNPNFRANIKLFEGQVFFIEGWLTAFVNHCPTEQTGRTSAFVPGNAK
ncbi:hypothetical protein BGX26_001646 [Mortierella sp. AD094]|nr:hypothetical protein BGX26_001646 [Mortierella sp. AD094]